MITPLHRPLDLAFTGKSLSPNPFYTRLEGHFTSPSGQVIVVPGFYAGDSRWIVRFSPVEPGTWRYRIYSRDIPEVDGAEGLIDCAGGEDNPGRLRINKNYPQHFCFEDGTPHFMNGYECDWLWAMDLGKGELTKTRELVKQIKSHRFNTVLMNVYAHDCPWTPDLERFGEGHVFTPPVQFLWVGSNEEPDHSRMNTLFFEHFDRVMAYLLEEEIQVHLYFKVYNKEVNYPQKYSPQDDLYFKYITARYQAYPNLVWDFSKEAKNEADKKYILNRLNYIKSRDGYHHLVTTHDDPGYFLDKEHTRSVDFFTAQQHTGFFYSALAQKERLVMPYFNSEFQYEHGPEGVEDITYGVSQTPEESIQRAWEVVLAGAYPAYYYTYTAWNIIDYRYDPPGAAYFGILYDFITSLEWWRFQPSCEAVQPNTGLSMIRGEEEMVVFPGLRDRPRNTVFLTAPWDFSRYSGYWMDIYTGEKIEVKSGDLKKNARGLTLITIPFESSTGVLYLIRS